MSRCKDCDNGFNENGCGMNGVADYRCCYYCEHKSKCEGFCGRLGTIGDYEDVARECEDFLEE